MSKKISDLAKTILYHKKLYYAGKPEISDSDFDRLEENLRRLDAKHPILDYVGSFSSGKVPHAVPMLSLAKTYAIEELIKWKGEHDVIAMFKIDGSSLSLVYENGFLKVAKTRGNGKYGENVTDKAFWIKDIPDYLQGNCEIRGEVFCREKDFSKIVKEAKRRNLEPPTSLRNVVAGVLGRKENYDLSQYFSFFAFDVIGIEFKTENQKFDWLEKQKFLTPNHKICKSEKSILAYLDDVKNHESGEGDFGVDGAVFSYNDLKLHEELGSTTHHPRYKMSFKWQGETAVSTITNIEWATSRNGIVTPVAIIEPVQLSGAKITNVTLHNASHVMNFSLKAGDRIEIVRSGEVIPKFLRVVEARKGQLSLPKKCPSCNGGLDYDDVRLLCRNVNCPAQISGKILNWMRCVEIDDLSEKRLQQMIDTKLVSSVVDLYKLNLDSLLTLPQTKEKLAQKLFDNIQASKKLSLARFLHGLGISGMGLHSWEKLLEEYSTLDSLREARVESLASIHGFAEKTAQFVVEGLRENKKLIDELLKLGLSPKSESVSVEKGTLSGKSFVITGSLSRPRAQIEKDVKAFGGKVSSSVSAKTFAVICNDKSSGSSKLKKAEKFEIPVISEQELSKLME